MIIADTGFWVGLFDAVDAYHSIALKAAETRQEPLITTIPVITEVCYLLQTRRGQHFATALLRSHRRGAFQQISAVLGLIDGKIVSRFRIFLKTFEVDRPVGTISSVPSLKRATEWMRS